jgi:ADP-glucose pyrophosphorylase
VNENVLIHEMRILPNRRYKLPGLKAAKQETQEDQNGTVSQDPQQKTQQQDDQTKEQQQQQQIENKHIGIVDAAKGTFYIVSGEEWYLMDMKTLLDRKMNIGKPITLPKSLVDAQIIKREIAISN